MLTIKKTKMSKWTLAFDLTDDQLEKLKEAILSVTDSKPVEKLDALMNTDDVLRKYKVARRTLNRWKVAGLPYIKGKPNLYRSSDVEDYIKRNLIKRK